MRRLDSREEAARSESIIEACHELDTGAGAPHDCHEFAESDAATDATCAEKEDDCLASCGH